ncbi:MAG TPA: multidrug ABC transporter ATP-binding protein, partial [Roseateles sp.]
MASLFQPLLQSVTSRFERLVDPYPETPAVARAEALPTRFFAFLWRCADGVRRHLFVVTLFTAGIAAVEALLFSLMARLVDWLSAMKPAELWTQPQPVVLLLLGVLGASIVLAGVQALMKYQGVFGNFPMRLRWIFHRRMLAQSLSFFGDEFAGRIATKVMQTALAVRDTWLIVVDILVYVAVYFGTLVAIVASFDAWLMAPFAAWLALYLVALRFFVPRLGKIA